MDYKEKTPIKLDGNIDFILEPPINNSISDMNVLNNITDIMLKNTEISEPDVEPANILTYQYQFIIYNPITIVIASPGTINRY